MDVSVVEIESSDAKKLTLQQAHAKLGHADLKKIHRTTKATHWNLKDTIMEQKNAPKSRTRVRAQRAGE